ncbi:uncharacterized protein LAESUDRAFT_654074, partial [Laetiporus sulphureus 93-53]
AGPPKPRSHFTSTEDLLTRFNLLPAYNKYVRPYSAPVEQPTSTTINKGKGKEKERSVPPGSTPPIGADGTEEEGKGEKKAKNTYRQLIKGLPGKHSIKKDDYLTTMIQVPPKQRIAIKRFDLRTQRDAFSVSLEGIKAWNIAALVEESPQAREDRKKRKELRKFAKAQGQAALAAMGTPRATGLPVTPATMATSISTPTAAHTPARTGTPKPASGMTRTTATSIAYQSANPVQHRTRTPLGIGTPHSIGTPAAGTLPTPGPTNTFTPARSTPGSTPAPVAGPDSGVAKRGVKREREYSMDGVQMGTTTNRMSGQAQSIGVNGGGTPKPASVAGAKAGNAGVRPRPLKKQRMDVQGQSRGMPLQQPTPHG